MEWPKCAALQIIVEKGGVDEGQPRRIGIKTG